MHDEVVRQKAAELTEVLHPWRQNFHAVEAVEDSRPGSAAAHLVEAARNASLVVVGRHHYLAGLHIAGIFLWSAR